MNGMLFHRTMLPLVIDETKTVTRREMKPQPPAGEVTGMLKAATQGWWIGAHDETINGERYDVLAGLFKPPYRPGQVVYVREPWLIFGDHWHWWADFPKDTVTWRSPYALRASDARHFLKIEDVRPEKFNLEAMTQEEWRKEGGELARRFLIPMQGKWLWRYEFKKTERPE